MVNAKKDIIEFLKSSEDYSLLIEGKWGVGRTRFRPKQEN